MNIFGKQHILTFNGKDTYIDLGPIPTFDPTKGMTFTSWIRPTGRQGLQATILSHDFLDFEPQIQDGQFVFEAGHHLEYSAGKVNLHQWMYLVAIVDPSRTSGQIRLFVNGKLTASHDRPTPLNYTDSNHLYIGSRSKGLFYQGSIASVGLWNRPLSDSEVKLAMYQEARPNEPDLVGFWKLDEGSGTIIHDLSVNNYHGELKGIAQWKKEGPVAQHNHRMKQKGAGYKLDIPIILHSSDVGDPLPQAPASGKNGELLRFKQRVLQHKDQQIAQAKTQAHVKKQEALAHTKVKLDRAHRNTARKINSTRFDYLYFISEGKVNRVDPTGKQEHRIISVDKKSIQVDAKKKWQNTGINVEAGGSLDIRYTSGKWTIWLDGDLFDAAGKPNMVGTPGFSLENAKQSGLIGKIGNHIFEVGNHLNISPTQSGTLELIINDDWNDVNNFTDNNGSISVEISYHFENKYTLDIALDQGHDKIYMAKTLPPYGINVMNMDGSEFRQLYQTSGAVVSLTVDHINEKLYWIENSGWIMEGKTDGTSLGQLFEIAAPNQAEFLQIHLDQPNQTLYWTSNQGIWSRTIADGFIKLVIPPHEAPRPIDVLVDSSANHIYWLDKELRMLRRANLDGTNIEDLYTVENPIRGLAMDAPISGNAALKEIYWAEREETLNPLTPNLIAHFPLNRSDLGVTINEVNSHVVGKLIAPEWVTSADPRFQHLSDTVLSFDGKETQIVVSDHPSLRIPFYTMEAWIRPIQMPGEPILTKGVFEHRTHEKFLFSLEIVNDNCLRHTFIDNSRFVNTPQGSLKWNTWQHVAITNDGKTAKTFINGLEMASTSVNGIHIIEMPPTSLDGINIIESGPMFPDVGIPFDAGALTIGKSTDGNNFFRGEMNEIRIWDKALSAEEIRKNMQFYRKYYAVRGTVDGSQHVEHLFEFPSEGGLQIASQQSMAHEKRALAYRNLKNNQVLAKEQIVSKQTETHKNIVEKQQALVQQRNTSQEDIAKKQAKQFLKRANGQVRLHTAKNKANQKIDNANKGASRKRQEAHIQAAQMKSNADASAKKMKQKAQAKRSNAQREKDKY